MLVTSAPEDSADFSWEGPATVTIACLHVYGWAADVHWEEFRRG
jgi:hypothetical protein